MFVILIFCIFVIVVSAAGSCISSLIPLIETNYLYAILFACAGILIFIDSFRICKYIRDTIDTIIERNESQLRELERRENLNATVESQPEECEHIEDDAK